MTVILQHRVEKVRSLRSLSSHTYFIVSIVIAGFVAVKRCLFFHLCGGMRTHLGFDSKYDRNNVIEVYLHIPPLFS